MRGKGASHQIDLFQQCIEICFGQLLLIGNLAVGAETAKGPAEGNVEIQPQILFLTKIEG